jgi:hypothetical protein
MLGGPGFQKEARLFFAHGDLLASGFTVDGVDEQA